MQIFIGNAVDDTRADTNAIRDERGAWTWRQLEGLVTRAANAFIAMRIRQGSPPRIALVARNSKEVVLAHLASRLAGVQLIAVNYHLTADEQAYIYRDSDTAIVLADPTTAPAAMTAAKAMGAAVVTWRSDSSDCAGVLSWESLLTQAEDVELHGDSPTFRPVLYTSGTTGFPKAVLFPQRLFGSDSSVADHLDSLRSRAPKLAASGMTRRRLLQSPLYHVSGVNALSAPFMGTSCTILDHFDAHEWMAAIERDRCTDANLVPTQAIRLLRVPPEERGKYDVSSLETLGIGASAVPAWLKEELIAWIGEIVTEGYGSTEAGMVSTITSAESRSRPGSVGRPLPDTEVIIRDDSGGRVGPGVVGRIFVHNAEGLQYLHESERTQASNDKKGAFPTGDLGYLDDEGYLYVTGRESELVVTGGVNVYPAEAERVLLLHPQVADAVALGEPHSELGEILVAVVVPVDISLSAEDVTKFCQQHLARYKCPRRVIFVDDLGRTAIGKVNKVDLRERLLEAHI